MNFKITQIQSKALLEEHANSSSNFMLISRYEWILAPIFLITGIIILVKTQIAFLGVLLIVIGLWELIQYPNRVDRWVNKKIKEPIFNKEVLFSLNEDDLCVSIDDMHRTNQYQNMRVCLISDTGLLFKVSYTEYYYISFSSIGAQYNKIELIPFIESRFAKQKIKIKNKDYNKKI